MICSKKKSPKSRNPKRKRPCRLLSQYPSRHHLRRGGAALAAEKKVSGPIVEAVQPPSVSFAADRKLLGYCVGCGCSVYEGNEMRTSTGLYCRMCYGERVKTAHMSSVRTYNYSDDSSFGWGFLSFLIPILGLILFIVWHKDRARQGLV